MGVVELTAELVSRPSVTPKDSGILEYIASLLPTFEAIRLDHGEVRNLLLTCSFGEGLHVAFAGHIDVVPAGNGWTREPFAPMIDNGRLYGRGTQDMKSGVAAFVEAVRAVGRFAGRISLILTSDEEGDGIYGTDLILAHMKEQGMLPDLCIVAEPTCEQAFGDVIKIGRRGSVNGTLKILGQGGHAAYPEKARNPIDAASALLPLLCSVQLDEGDEAFAPSRLVVTNLHAGEGTVNVIPHDLTILFNVRHSTATTPESIEDFVRDACAQANVAHYELSLKPGAKPFVTKAGPYAALLLEGLEKAIHAVTGITPVRSTAGGTSDARYVAAYGIDVVEFGVRNDAIHAPDESVPLAELEALEAVFGRFLAELGARP